MQKFLGLTFLSSVSALGVAACCVLPMTMMLLGLGGSWLAIFGKIAAASYYVLVVATALVAASWIVSRRRGSMARLKWWLIACTALVSLAWVIVHFEARINDHLIAWM